VFDQNWMQSFGMGYSKSSKLKNRAVTNRKKCASFSSAASRSKPIGVLVLGHHRWTHTSYVSNNNDYCDVQSGVFDDGVEFTYRFFGIADFVALGLLVGFA